MNLDNDEQERLKADMHHHVNALAHILNSMRDCLQVRAVIGCILVKATGGRTTQVEVDLKVAPNLPTIDALEKELGLVEEDGYKGA